MIQGIGDDMLQLSRFAKGWEKHGFSLHMHAAPWKKNRTNFQAKLEKLITRIDDLSQNGDLVSLVGISAGGSLALSAFAKRKEKIQGVVLVASRLNKGKRIHPVSMRFLGKAHPAFKEAVMTAEKEAGLLSQEDKKKILTIRGLVDEMVPVSSSHVEGATNIRIPTVFHLLTHGAALVFYKHKIFNFLRSTG